MAINDGEQGAAPGNAEAAGPDGEQPRGGCLNLGWGCLPVLVGLASIPGSWFF